MAKIANVRIGGLNALGEAFSFGWHSLLPTIEVMNPTEYSEAIAGSFEGEFELDPPVYTEYALWYDDSTTFTQVDTAYYDDGVLEATGQAFMSVAGQGTSAPALPAQVATVITMKSAVPGPGGRGRFYLPSPNVNTLTANGNWATGYLNATIDFIERFYENTTGFAGSGPWVIGGASHNKDDLITTFRVGNRADTQRRRANGSPESYVSWSVP